MERPHSGEIVRPSAWYDATSGGPTSGRPRPGIMAETQAGPPNRKRAIQDVWARTLSQIPTALGRIAYLASLRDPNTGRYQHFGLAQLYSAEESDQALRESHGRVLSEWLNFSLAEQQDDLESYLASLEGDRATVLAAWTKLQSYRNLMPVDASAAESELFVTDLELILRLLRGEPSPSSPSPAA